MCHPQRRLHRPEVAWVGLTETEAKAQGIKVKKGLFPWTASGRAIANGRDEGVTKLLFDDSPASHAGREHRHGGGGGAWDFYRFAAGSQVSASV